VWFKTENDMQYAVVEYGIALEAASVIPYGVELDALPAESELLAAKATLQKEYGIPQNEIIILFNGTLNYQPNLEALVSILDGINPILLAKDLKYKILICGKNLPADMNNLQAYQSKNIIYCGFVQDIDLYFKGCDIFLNPLQDGGGIKTKLVEALGFGKKCISSDNGAIGVSEYAAQGRLLIVPDRNWKAYADAICGDATQISNDNSLFYQTYSWKNIALKALSTIAE
jgi:glycosyltransferase involved in cell wall biosynthesis